ncbi:MAG: hypothetical protein JXR89_09720, partial [Deltaproteobacteria bacterium]|nr:hypothetical protein [Deltaproteobacteria bacterium]
MKGLLNEWRKLLIIGLLLIIYGCVATQETRNRPADIQPPAPSPTQSSPPTPAAPLGIYEHKIVELTSQQCAQCHFPVYDNIARNGGKHQINCRDCHESFHTFRPGMKWSEALPKCATCHGAAHGQAFLDCLACHADPHAPLSSLTDLKVLAKACETCHSAQKAEVVKYKSAHTAVACSECHHTRHGHKPACTECHSEPHAKFVDNAGCMGCHPVHSPREINYPAATENSLCASCHGDITRALAASPRKHSTLQCVFCHADRHGYVPDCGKCHSQPHS